jgi:hypothetical protein
MEKKDIGTFVHVLLENYFRKFMGRRMIAEELSTDEMDALVDRLFKTEFGGDQAGSAFLMKLQIRRHLGEFITDYQVPVIRALQEQKNELRLLSLEQRLNIRREIAGVTFRLGAKVDRTETRAGELYILDYKTTANEKYFGINFEKLDLEDRATWNQAVRSLQLSVYNLILSLIHGKPGKHIHCLFLMLGKNRLSPGIEFSPYDEEDENVRCEQIQTMEVFIERLLLEIIDPQIPFDPGVKSADSCDYCRYVPICNKQ